MAHRSSSIDQGVHIPSDSVTLNGFFSVPANASAAVAFAHGSGSSRFSPRNQAVAHYLNDHGIATLLFDLLSEEEQHMDDQTRHLRFDIHLLSNRLTDGVDWLSDRAELLGLPIGLFGASTGAAAATVTGSVRPEKVKAIVSRGGRPDLAGTAIAAVASPTLLIVGEQDLEVLKLNREAMTRMTKAQKHLEIIPGATHLFTEPGKLEKAAQHARSWFARYLHA